MNSDSYYKLVIGKKFDVDRSHGVQCIDAFKHYCKVVLGFDISNKSICFPSGYAYSIWSNYRKLGFNKYFIKVSKNEFKNGDWVIWKKGSKDCKYSHIAMFIKDNFNGTGMFLGQNQNGIKEYNLARISYNGILGGLRPKINNNKYVNLPSSALTWRVYKINSKPIKKNAIGMLRPYKFGGLSYLIYEFRDNGNTAVIKTRDFGTVKIYIAKETGAIITNN